MPDQLLQAHEEGRVVFFCGAGISRPAGLPKFSVLVKRLYTAMRTEPNPVEASAINAGQYDKAVELLEAKLQEGRQTVRSKLADILTPDLNAPNATATHEALLTLATNHEDHTRLITTNFDRVFEEVIAKKSLKPDHYRAPLLPVPKKRWYGLVYLHGLLTENPTESDLEKLVISSGDFGLAYLTEGWAARFVSELLRNFVVCFVGYSIDDPVLRYMIDALAADRLLGESPPETFAFGGYSKGKAEQVKREWMAKNVIPVLYREVGEHEYLHQTLQAWSKTYRDGALGKEQIVVRYARSNPDASTEQDDFVGRMLWALSDSSGLPAKCFAKLDPVPSLKWLAPLSGERPGHADLWRSDIDRSSVADQGPKSSLTYRPATDHLAPWMGLVRFGTETPRWNKVMQQIAEWLVRHLDDPALLLWFARRGGVLHDEMARTIECNLERLDKLKEDKNQPELDRIRENAPNAIPRPMMRALWLLLLTGHIRETTWADEIGLHRWCEHFQRDGLTVSMRLDLREKLKPYIELKPPLQLEPFRAAFGEEDDQTGEPQPISELVDAKVILASNNVRVHLGNLASNELWTEALPELLDEFTGLLRDALDLMREVGQADERSDHSFFHQPSISKHQQNRDRRANWTVLIELTRDAWLATYARSSELALIAAEAWWRIPYPVFRRLAFFAAAQENVIPCRRALDWLLSGQGWWLWSFETRREAMRLLVSLAPRLQQYELHLLEKAILQGPPRAMYRDDIGPEDWAYNQDRAVWLRLAKLSTGGASLSAAGSERMDEIKVRFPDWQLTENESDEFFVWVEEFNESRKFVATPRERQKLIEWLKADADSDSWQRDDWSERCREDFDTISFALSELAEQNIWRPRRWREALSAWSRDKPVEQSWDKMAPILDSLPDKSLQDLSHGLSLWLRAIAKTVRKHESTFLKLCDRLLFDLDEGEQEIDEPVAQAINHPVGRATEALLNWWHRDPLGDDQGLDEDLKLRFSRICNPCNCTLRHGRVILAARLITLFRVDRDWTTKYMLPLFEWKRSEAETQAVWQGFLWPHRLYPPLVERDAFKEAFLDTAKHYTQLGRHAVQYSSLLTFAAMEPGLMFTHLELAKATESLPQDGLDNAARTVVRALESAGEQSVEYWENRVKPYLNKIWPKAGEIASPLIAENFALLCIASKDAFPAALNEVSPWLQELHYPDPVVFRLQESKLHDKFPEETLRILAAIIEPSSTLITERLAKRLKDCLRAIRAKMPELEQDHRFRKLAERLRVHGQSLD